MTAHIKIVEPWEKGPPTRVPAETQIKPSKGGGLENYFFCGVYVDDFVLVKVQHEPEDKSALVASASLADCIKALWSW